MPDFIKGILDEDNFLVQKGIDTQLKNNSIIVYGETVNHISRFTLDTLAPINMEITILDTVNNIVSGLFDFRLKEIDDSKDTIRISNGRFDANYWPL